MSIRLVGKELVSSRLLDELALGSHNFDVVVTAAVNLIVKL